MIVDLQRHLFSLEEITKQLKIGPSDGPSDVDHLNKFDNRFENVTVGGLDHQSMEGVSQCMNVDEPYKNWTDVLDNFYVDGLDHQSVEGVSQCTRLNDEYESVAIDSLISLRSYNVGHISKVRELINDVLDTPSIGLDSDACVSELMDVDQPSFVKNVLDDVHIDSVVKDADESDVKTIEDLTRSPTAPKKTMSVPEGVMVLFRDKNRMEMSWTFPWVKDGHVIRMDFWEKLVGRSHTKRGWLSSDYPLYYADGVNNGVPWFANNVEKVYFPINEKDSHWVLGELHIISAATPSSFTSSIASALSLTASVTMAKVCVMEENERIHEDKKCWVSEVPTT
ncbi:hypothetical protein Tco_1303246 [Tanacetum coccineum]